MDLTNIDPFAWRPKNWQDFERLCCDLWRAEWNDPNAQLYGREGQAQNGVDIYSSPDYKKGTVGIQCKGLGAWDKSGSLSNKEIISEVEKAKGFYPKLTSFLIVYTGKSDNKIQKHASEITEKNKEIGLFSVHVKSWTDIWSLLLQHKNVMQIHYRDMLPNIDLLEHFQIFERKYAGLSSQIDTLTNLIVQSNTTNLYTISEDGEQVVKRFLSVFDGHKITKPTIVEILEQFSINLNDLYSPTSILSKINNDVLSFIQNKFYIEKQWILTGKGRIYENSMKRRWYKQPQFFARRLLELKKHDKKFKVLLVRSKGSNFEKAYSKGDMHDKEENVGIVIEIQNVSSSGIEYCTYENWEIERWNYSNARHYLKVIIIFLEKLYNDNSSYWFIGRTIEEDDFKKISSCEIIMANVFNKVSVGSAWYPEDFVNNSYELTKETEELQSVRKLYEDEKMDLIIDEFKN